MNHHIRIDDLETRQFSDLITARLIANGENITAILMTWQPKASVAPHRHPNEQVSYILEGEVIFTIEGKDYMIKKGEFCHIPPNALHGERVEAPVSAVIYEVFAPIRPDLIKVFEG